MLRLGFRFPFKVTGIADGCIGLIMASAAMALGGGGVRSFHFLYHYPYVTPG